MRGFAERCRPGFDVRADVLTWDLYVFEVSSHDGGTTVYVSRRGSDVEDFLRDLDAGRIDDELRRALDRPPRRRLRRPSRRPSWTVPQIGIEHEYRVVDDAGRQVDARTFLHDLGIEGVRADPGDPNAYRCPWGGAITCDGREVEIATAPIAIAPGFVEAVVAAAAAGRRAVEAVLPVGLRLGGYSTHLNVTSRIWGDARIARRYARTFAPALMLMLDRRDSPGLLVRPRPGRLELCGEFADGEVLAAAVALAAGSVLATQRWSRSRHLMVKARLVPAVERYGWFVDRTAFGPDLYTEGRSAVLVAGRGRRRTGGEQLAMAWAAGADALGERATPADRSAVEAMAGGRLALPSRVPPPADAFTQPGTAS